MKSHWAAIVLAIILFGLNAADSSNAQKRGRSAATNRKARMPELGRIDQLKESFQNDAGKVRLVALLSPT